MTKCVECGEYTICLTQGHIPANCRPPLFSDWQEALAAHTYWMNLEKAFLTTLQTRILEELESLHKHYERAVKFANLGTYCVEEYWGYLDTLMKHRFDSLFRNSEVLHQSK